MANVYRVPLVLAPQPEGGYTVTSPALPGLVTEGDSLEQALENVEDALRATLELYEDTGRPVPSGLMQDPEPARSRLTSSSPRCDLSRGHPEVSVTWLDGATSTE
jgi:antitoxin HicB